jgi:hypothetical protein
VSRDGERVIARFDGYLSAEAGEQSARAFIEAMGDDDVVAVFDIREMAGYASDARRAWAAALKPHGHRMMRLELVGGNALVRMGGSVLGALLGVPVVNRDG